MLNILNKVKGWVHIPQFHSVLLSSVLGLNSYSHCNITRNIFLAMDIKVLPALSDNYMYLIVDKTTNTAAIVDPYNAKLVQEVVKKEDVNLTTVLTTHHHADHAGGNKDLVNLFPEKIITVVGGDKRVDAITKLVKDNDEFTIGNLNVKCLHTPCHTTGHICYYVTTSVGDKAVFTGDTLFISGCGRFFEGTPEMMYNALIKKLGSLPDETKVYCGHEYTETNLKFASYVEPDNANVREKLISVQNTRKNNDPTVPSTIGDEKIFNPFMRVHDASLQNFAKSEDPIETMGYLRQQKDVFKAR